jgi:hypothetical protein
MKYYFIIPFFLLTLNASPQENKNWKAFAEMGLGYSLNADGGSRFNISQYTILGSNFFTHGANSELHFGVLLGRKVNIGAAAQFGTSLFWMDKKLAVDYFKEKNPGLSIFFQTHGIHRLSNIQCGPLVSLTFNKWAFDAELLGGYSTMTIPHLFAVGSNKPYPNSEELYLYIYRPRQSLQYKSVTPSIGARRSFGNYYLFSRCQASFGWGNGSVAYEYYPGAGFQSGRKGLYDFSFVNVMVGSGLVIH